MKSLAKKVLLPPEKIQQAQKLLLMDVGKRLEAAENALQRFLVDAADQDAFSVLYKFAHTLKGSGEMVNLRELSIPAAEIITALTLVRSYGVKIDTGLQNFINERMAEIRQQVVTHRPTRDKTSTAKQKDEMTFCGKKIMVVDDDPVITTLLQDSLTQAGYKVIVSYDLLAAEQQIASEQPDLMILDIIFPQGDGIEFCKRIRSQQNGKVIPIIFLSVKAKLQDRLSGFACGADDYIAKPFVMEELLARITAIFGRLQKYEQLVMEDELTGIFNRRYLVQRLQQEVDLAKREQAIFSVVMVDLDKFKGINDTYGHEVGDAVLGYFVDTFKQNLRTTDALCRCGGDEFVLIMPDTDRTRAVSVMERVRRVLKMAPYKGVELEIPLTFSAGVVCYPSDGVSAEELMSAADQVMYKAKEAGRNQIFTG